MTSASREFDLDDVLREEPFVRRLARSLVRDEAEVDDVVQQVWIEAQRLAGSSSRSWLAAVVRSRASNLRRGARRAEARERAAARLEALPSTVELLEREEVRGRVVEAVAGLPEKYRVVILLRHFEDLPIREVATTLDVPRETAATRLKRAHAMLRDALDASSGGDRRQWVLGLVPLALPSAGEVAAGVAGQTLVSKLLRNRFLQLQGVFAVGKQGSLILFLLIVVGLAMAAAARFAMSSGDQIVVAGSGATEVVEDRVDDVVVADGGVIDRSEASAAGEVERPETASSYVASLAQLTGRVVLPDGRPAVGEDVRLYEVDPVSITGELFVADPRLLDDEAAASLRPGFGIRSVTTDAQGRFAFGGVLPQGQHVLSTGMQNRMTTVVPLDARPAPGGSADVGTIRLEQSPTVTGLVVDASGQPVAGAVVVHSTLPAAATRTLGLDRLGESPAFVMDRPTFEPAEPAARTITEHDDFVAWRAAAGKLFRNRGISAEEDPGVMFFEPSPGMARTVLEALPTPAVTDASGRFTMDRVSDGAVSLSARADGLGSVVVPFRGLDDGGNTDVGVLRLQRGEDFSARIVDASGTALSGARVRVAMEHTFRVVGFRVFDDPTQVDGDGWFVRRGLPRGELMVAVQSSPGAPWSVHGPYESDEENAEVRLDPGTILRLRAVDAAGSPVAGARFMVRQGLPMGELSHAGLQPEVAMTAVDARGEARSDSALVPGWYTVVADAPGRLRSMQSVRIAVEPGEDVSTFDCVLPSSTPLTVRVEDRDGQPVAGAQVFVQPTGFRPWAVSFGAEMNLPRRWGATRLAAFEGLTRTDGTLVVDSLDCAGEDAGSTVFVRHVGRGVGAVRVARGDDAARVTLSGHGAIEGRLTNRGEAPGEGRLAVEATPVGDGASVPMPRVRVRVEADGRFRIDGLPVGEWELKAVGTRPRSPVGPLTDMIAPVTVGLPGGLVSQFGMRRRTVHVQVEADGVSEVAFDMDPDARVAGQTGYLSARFFIDGKPAAGYHLVRPLTAWRDEHLAELDGNGQMPATEVPAGVHELELRTYRSSGGVWKGEVEVGVDSGETLEIDLSRATVRGVVRRADGDPAIGHRVEVETAVESGTGRASGETDAEGRFELRVLSGHSQVEVHGTGGVASRAGLRCAPDSSHELELTLTSDGTFAGRVEGIGERSIQSLYLTSETYGGVAIIRDGVFAVHDIPPGDYALRFGDNDRESYAAIPDRIEISEHGRIDLVLRVGARD